MTTKIQKWGNSLGVRIPKEIAHKTHMREGSVISFSVKGEMLMLRHSRQKYTLAYLLKSFDKNTQHEEIDLGSPRGSEVW